MRHRTVSRSSSSTVNTNNISNYITSAEDDVLSLEFLTALEKRAAVVITDLNRALKSHQESRNQRTHGALVLAIATAQRVAKLLATVNEKEREKEKEGGVGGLYVKSSLTGVVPTAVFLQLESHRAAIRRALPVAVAAAETSGSDGAADTANALRSLLHTRSLLNVELGKVQGALDELAGSSESLQLLQSSLQDVNATVEMAQLLVRKLLSVKCKDDLILRISVVVFLLVVAYIIAQRIFGFFPICIA
ncbi:Sec20 [Trypanosoma melophagium]|uniref:Sec20 n=1 Tax=Trypanosoma melophagium TaxID=715481 RepID=UPI00351A5946|nr:Sec20 [Trypanosoma melophagium]